MHPADQSNDDPPPAAFSAVYPAHPRLRNLPSALPRRAVSSSRECVFLLRNCTTSLLVSPQLSTSFSSPALSQPLTTFVHTTDQRVRISFPSVPGEDNPAFSLGTLDRVLSPGVTTFVGRVLNGLSISQFHPPSSGAFSPTSFFCLGPTGPYRSAFFHYNDDSFPQSCPAPKSKKVLFAR